jgi:hypothetical protein
MQFQDHARQRLENVVDTLTIIRDAARELRSDTAAIRGPTRSRSPPI